jgi:hypothetical protein
LFLLLVTHALAGDLDQLRLDVSAGMWAGDSTGHVALGGGVGWQHGATFVELRHAALQKICLPGCNDSDTNRTSLLVGRRWSVARGPWTASADLAAGVGVGPDRSYVAPSPTAVGAVAQARVSAGTPAWGVQMLAMQMAGTPPFDTEVSGGIYFGAPLR